MKLFTKPILTFLLFMLTGLFRSLYADYDHALKWRTLTTPHFYIHFHNGIEENAKSLAYIAEEVYDTLQPKLHWTPASKTHLVLADTMDSANGFSTPSPVNKVVLYLARPEPDSVLNNYREWMRMLLLHEYTHTLNLDIVTGFCSFTRFFPGRVWFPSVFQPLWIQEGHAVYQESKETGMGRNNSSYTDMVMRTETVSGSLKSYSKSAVFPTEWPRGNVPYLYGGLFMDYLDTRYGYGSAANIFLENSDNVIPYLINKNAMDLFGKTFKELWKEWQEVISAKYTAQAAGIAEEGLTQADDISDEKSDASYPRFSQDGKSVFYASDDPHRGSALVKTDIFSGKSKRLCRTILPLGISLGPDGSVYVSDMEAYHSYSVYSEAWRYRSGYKRLTKRLRVKYIDISPDGREAVYVSQDRGLYSLTLNSPDFTSPTKLIADTDIQLAGPKFSPDGRKIVFSTKERDGSSNLLLYDRDTGKPERLTFGVSAIEPAWAPDGKIVFVSDAGGVYNLWELAPGKGKIRRLTNVLGGAFMPDVSPDGGKIVFSSYKKYGRVISVADYPAQAYEERSAGSKQELGRLPDFSYVPQTGTEIQSRSYNPIPSLLPRFIIPMLETNEIYPNKNNVSLGFYIFGIDALGRHNYSLSAFYTLPDEKRLKADFVYTYSGLLPDFTIGYYDSTIFIPKDSFPYSYRSSALSRELSRLGYLTVSLPFIFLRSQHQISVSGIYEYRKLRTVYPRNDLEIERNIYLSRIRLMYYYSNARTYTYSISEENGREFFIMSDIYNSAMLSDYTFYRLGASYIEYLPGVAANHVTALFLRGAAFIDKPDIIGSFSLGKYTEGSFGRPYSDIRSSWGLRGFEKGSHGEFLAAACIEYRMPLLQRDLAAGLFPVMFRALWLTAFVDFGNVWSGRRISDIKASAGIQLHGGFLLGYNVEASIFCGYAKGFGKYGEHQFYFGAGSQLSDILGNSCKRLDYL